MSQTPLPFPEKKAQSKQWLPSGGSAPVTQDHSRAKVMTTDFLGCSGHFAC
uniref:Uncharacterized protein n=1 Tax=Paramormyrops kingsleyae TaxID=1676925 RepID=A0A3B3SDL1_9TELE